MGISADFSLNIPILKQLLLFLKAPQNKQKGYITVVLSFGPSKVFEKNQLRQWLVSLNINKRVGTVGYHSIFKRTFYTCADPESFVQGPPPPPPSLGPGPGPKL